MNLTNPAELKSLLVRHGFNPQKRWGQHFLISPRGVEAILARLEGFSGVLEVGPGPGVLTSGASRIAQVTAVEIDRIAVSALSETAPLSHVVPGDALKLDLRPLLVDLPEPRAILSNMPYNITGPLLFKFSELADAWTRAVLMMQKEVGERVLAKAGSSDYGSLSVSMQTRFAISKVCDVPPGAFYPPPKVDSIVLQFEPLPSVPPESFFLFVRLGFKQPRKTLANNLVTDGRTRDEAVAALGSLGLDAAIRPHQLDLAEWQALWQRFEP